MTEDGKEEPQPTPPPAPDFTQQDGPSEEDIANAKRLLREATLESIGTGMLPELDHGSGPIDEDYGTDLERSTTVSDSQPSEQPPLAGPPSDDGGGGSDKMWECVVTDATTGAAEVAAGVVHFPVYDADGEKVGTQPVEWGGGEAPAGEYIYAAVPVQGMLVAGQFSYFAPTGQPPTIMAFAEPPTAVPFNAGSYLIPVARIQNRRVEGEEPPEEPTSITQYLEGSPVISTETLDPTSVQSTHPFKLIRVDETTWRIETEGSSIINDDDGSAITITALGDNRTSNGYVYIQCAITTGPVPSGTATVEVSATPKDEIEVSGGTQTYANLLIGQVYVNLAGDDLDISQAWNNAAILSMMFESGALRWAFQAHPSHTNSLTAGT